MHLKVFKVLPKTRLFSLSTPTPERNRKLDGVSFDFLHCVFYAVLEAGTCGRVFKVRGCMSRQYFCDSLKRQNSAIERITLIRVPQCIYPVVFWQVFKNVGTTKKLRNACDY